MYIGRTLDSATGLRHRPRPVKCYAESGLFSNFLPLISRDEQHYRENRRAYEKKGYECKVCHVVSSSSKT